MPFDLSVGGGQVVKVNEPTRTMFPDNLNGAVQYSLAHVLYKVLEVMGGSLGSFAAGFLVQFLERLEPALVERLTPLIDLLLSMPEMPAEFKDFLVKLKTPTSQADAVLLSAFGGSVASGIASSVIGVLTSPVVHGLNRIIRPERPSPNVIFPMHWRETIAPSELNIWLAEQGWSDKVIKAFDEILRPRAGIQDLFGGKHRRFLMPGDAESELRKRGFTDKDISLLNELSYRLFDESQIWQAGWRDLIKYPEQVLRLEALGYKDMDINILQELQWRVPGYDDLVRMAVREAFNPVVIGKYGYHLDFPDEFAKYMRWQGFKDFWAKAYWAAHWELPSLTLATEMLHREIITPDEYDTYLKVADYPVYWRPKIRAVSYQPYTRVDVRRMYRLGVLDEQQVYKCYRDLGYDDEHARNLTTFTIKYETKAGTDKTEDYRDLTYGIIEQAFRKDVISLSEAAARLKQLKYDADDVDVLTRLMAAKKQLDEIPDWGSEHSRDFKNLIEKAYTRRLISRTEAASGLAALGVSERVIDYILAIADYNYAEAMMDKSLKVIGDAYVARAISRTDAITQFGQLGLPASLQNQHLEEWDIEREIRSRRLTEAQYRRAWQTDIITRSEYIEALRGLGYTEYDINILVKMAQG